MICPYCNKQISDNNQFCPECGQNLATASENNSANSLIGIMQLSKYQNEMTEKVMCELVGKTLTAHDSHMEGLGWIHHEYWQLTFKDEDNLDYAYIETIGPREDDEKPVYKGTYSYTLSRSVFGNYTVRVNSTTYKLKVNDSNVPTGISR